MVPGVGAAPPARPSLSLACAGAVSEEELVRRIHKKVGGPSKLSTYDDPAHVRGVVIAALAGEQRAGADAERVAKGELSAFERRVVRTVTNRGAAVRSRMRQRRELSRLRDELRAKDARLAQLEAALSALTAPAAYAPFAYPPPAHGFAPPPPPPPPPATWAPQPQPPLPPQPLAAPQPPPHAYPSSPDSASPPPSCTASAVSSASLSTAATAGDAAAASLDRDLFGSLIDQLIAPPA